MVVDLHSREVRHDTEGMHGVGEDMRPISQDVHVEAPSAVDVLTAMVAMFASGDPAEASAVVADGYLDHQGLGEGLIRGVEGFAHVVRTNHAAYEHQEIIIEDLFGSGDRAVARIRWRGRLRGGEEVERETIDIVRVAAGRAVEHWGART